VKYVIKVFGFLAMLLILVLPCSAQDYLEGGYAGSYTGDIGQYFTDPIFRSPSSSYVSPDPAVRGMQESLDRPIAPVGSSVSKTTKGISTGSPVRRYTTGRSTTGISTGKTPATVLPVGAAGRWSMQLSDGRSIYLELYQSGARLFGRGSITLGKTTQGALASGSVSGNKMTLDLIPESGTELYSMSPDMSRLDLASKYTVYKYGAQPGYGTVKASKLP
jgi:hypothetical protein